MHISFRKISNGFLASEGPDYGIIGQNSGEKFYPSLEAMIADAEQLFRKAVEREDREEALCIAQQNDAAQWNKIGVVD